MMRTRKSGLTPGLAALSAVALLCHAAPARAADPVHWVDWTSADASNVYGSANVDGTVVGVTYTGERAFVQTGCGTNYWWPSSGYISATVPNAPPGCDIIALHRATAKKITFSEPVTNPLFAVVSLNGNGYRFDRDFEILSYARGYWGTGTLTKRITTYADGSVTYDLIGSGEPHGVLQFIGTFSTVSWTSLSYEYWNGFSIAIENRAEAVPPEIHVYDGAAPGSAELVSNQAEAVDFGDVELGGSAARTFTIHNAGTGPLNFTSLALSGSGAFTTTDLPPAIAAGATTTFTVTFAAVDPGPHAATVTIESDDPLQGTFRFPITATAGPRDSDGDGVPDPDDRCPGADDKLDTDGDRNPDCLDRCPLDNPDDSDADGVCESKDLCTGDDASGDTDGDRTCDDRDVCPHDPLDDADADGLCGDVDVCGGTVFPESVPTRSLKPNHYALLDANASFEVGLARGGVATSAVTLQTTGGCSCEQIIAALGLGHGHAKHGCSPGVIGDWYFRLTGIRQSFGGAGAASRH